MVDIRSRLGWKPDLPDQRDTLYKAPGKVLKALPDSVDLRATQPKIWDQSALGACTAHATCGQCWFLDKTDPYEPSRLFVYYNTRILEGTINQDSGASIRNSIKSVVRWGFCSEADWPYQTSKFTRKPPQKAYANALKEKIANDQLEEVIQSLKTFPIVDTTFPDKLEVQIQDLNRRFKAGEINMEDFNSQRNRIRYNLLYLIAGNEQSQTATPPESEAPPPKRTRRGGKK